MIISLLSLNLSYFFLYSKEFNGMVIILFFHIEEHEIF
ncbi:hypothetical protein DJ66_1126 [Candidatus Liberibacter solanacearum]|uniref:Uncharacterized protein n=1 Tax=Candidatus Liberibacter solanacearum TaxID=556287 RepID=A0A0F4VLM4_9HYPH|nr:hypothetical protein DJ66_1126 [Candidatus Liberibacter solanacearum]